MYLLNSDQIVHATTDAAVGQYVAYTLWQEHTDLDQLVPVKFNSHKLSKSEQNFSQWEAEGFALIFCLQKEEALLSFGNMIYHTDARGLTFINRYANASSKMSRWDILIRSFNMTIRFLPNTASVIRVTDIFTRSGQQTGPKCHLLSKSDIKDFIHFDFQGVPDLSIVDTMDFINKLFLCFRQTTFATDAIKLVNTYFPTPSPLIYNMTHTNDVIYRGAGDHIAQIFTVSDPLLKSSTVISEIPLEKEISVPSIDFRSHISSSPVPIKEILSNYLV